MRFKYNSYAIPPLSEFNCLGWKAKGLLDLTREWLLIPNTYPLSSMDLVDCDFLVRSISSTLPFPLILRSSANFEDSTQFSFAWFFESYICHTRCDILKAIHSIKYFPKKNIQLAYPNFDIDLLVINMILQPYLTCESSWVFVSKSISEEYGYGEFTYGQPTRILHDGEMDTSFLIWEEWIQIEWDIPERYRCLISHNLWLVQNYFPDRSYQYEWCISYGLFYFLQKRPFLSS